MKIQFYKYQGAGNDFVVIDNRSEEFPAQDQTLVARLCDRRFGIGADGQILLENAQGYDFKMRYYNADGAEGSMCGNGGRCIAAFARDMGVIKGSQAEFIAVDGAHQVNYENDLVCLRMKDVTDIKDVGEYLFADTGSPHYVEFVDDIKQVNVFEKGRKIRYSELFAEIGGTNVNFAQLNDDKSISIRTYERGVEDETLACGTGATAVALAAHKRQLVNSKSILLHTLGGDLTVSFEYGKDIYTNVWLTGGAEKVFEGSIEI